MEAASTQIRVLQFPDPASHYLHKAVSLRRKVPALKRDPDASKQVFLLLMEDLQGASYLIAPSRCKSWIAVEKKKIIISGTSTKHWNEAIKLAASMLWWYTSGDEPTSRKARRMATLFKVIITIGIL